MQRIILASKSPRRKKLLEEYGLLFDIIPSNVNESIDYNYYNDVDIAKSLAESKADDVARALDSGIVIGADTIVSMDGIVLGKPKDKDEAFEMLSMLNNNKHKVITGITVIDVKAKKKIVDHEQTFVKFGNITKKKILDYIDTKEPYDKAGAYGIQGKGTLFVEKIEGCYNNVVGLPLYKLFKILDGFGISIL